MNSSSLRSKSHIIQELEGALDSHHVSNHPKESKENHGSKIDSFFKSPQNGRGILKRTVNDDKPGKKPRRASRGKKNEETSAKSSVNVHKESLILFDEIEVVFKEDVGFWPTVVHFIKKSKKPIVITTNDEFIQEKMNLNVERIEFERPRVDASIRFLVSVAGREMPASKLETSTAYEIVRECKCDMRKSLVQLQALIGGARSALIDQYKANSRNGTLNLNQALSGSLFLACPVHNHNAFFENIFFLDGLVRRMINSQTTLFNDCVENSSSSFKPFDKFILRDGLTDNSNQSQSSSNNSKNGVNTAALQNAYL